jgi:hypothetical protein
MESNGNPYQSLGLVIMQSQGATRAKLWNHDLIVINNSDGLVLSLIFSVRETLDPYRSQSASSHSMMQKQ